ncbi:MAG TPA: glycosyltransferase [Thermodesulfovibrionales bacterium]|nr:glycosyltransferase [Thermodesulfovibrionales bacterium]
MSNKPDIFVGITSWNSELLLGHCLRSVIQRVSDMRSRIVVLDNASTDNSIGIAQELGVEVITQQSSQADALNKLYSVSRATYTLLMHADVILLSDRWFDLCKSKLNKNIVLVSPEDIGCGPYTRPFGAGMPESSFLFFDTDKLKKTRVVRWKQRFRVPVPQRVLDFYGEHITHNIPVRLKKTGLTWFAMNVHVSDRIDSPMYQPAFLPKTWTEELAYLRYGLGNFCSIEGVITHYHNWFDRAYRSIPLDSTEEHRCGIPLAYIKLYTDAFIRDYTANRLILPSTALSERKPVAL